MPATPSVTRAGPDGAVRSRRAQIEGTTVHWLEGGRGSTVLLVHGLGDSAGTWRRVLPRLAAAHHVVAVDLPGSGQSGPATSRPLLPWMLRILERLLDHTASGRPAAVVGNSVGGALALRLALHHPRRVDRLVLVDPAGGGRDVPLWWKTVAFQRLVRILLRPALAALPRALFERIVVGAFLRMVFYRPDRIDEDEAHDYARHLSTPADIADFLERAHDIVSGLEAGIGADPGRLRVPVLIVWGRQDRLAPVRDAPVLRERLPGAGLRIIDGCGHMPQLERPAQFLRAVLPFLDGAGGGDVTRSRRRDAGGIAGLGSRR